MQKPNLLKNLPLDVLFPKLFNIEGEAKNKYANNKPHSGSAEIARRRLQQEKLTEKDKFNP